MVTMQCVKWKKIAELCCKIPESYCYK